jgi:hypothetical protein
LAAQGGALLPAATAQSIVLQKSSGQRIAQVTAATHRPKTARRRVTDIIDVAVLHKKREVLPTRNRKKKKTKCRERRNWGRTTLTDSKC